MMTVDKLDFRITLDDGSVHEETVNLLDMTDIPEEELQDLAARHPTDVNEITAWVLHKKLSIDVPVDMLKEFLEGLPEGQGILV